MRSTVESLSVCAVCLAGVLAVVNTPVYGQAVRYVDASAAPGGDGVAWETAYADLQDALDEAALDPTIRQIWIAAGTYRPDRGSGDRAASFQLVSGVALFGGFAGDEMTLEERDPNMNISTLSGDLNHDDVNDDLDGDGFADFVNNGENSLNVVTGEDVDDVQLDGLRIAGGNADYDGAELRGGGGVFLLRATGTLRDVEFQFNSAGTDEPDIGGFGGGLFLVGGEISINGCHFRDNRGMNGGGLAASGITPDSPSIRVDTVASIVDCVFERNYSEFQTGGAMWTTTGDALGGGVIGRITVSRTRFEGNAAEHHGCWIDQNSPELLVEDCEFIGNSAEGFGGCFSHSQTAGPDVEPALVRRCRFIENRADEGDIGVGAAVLIQATNVILESCEFVGNAAGRSIIRSGPVIGFSSGAKNLTILNTVIRDNEGVAILGDGNPLLKVVNSTIASNTTTSGDSGGILTSASLLEVANSIFWDNTGRLAGQSGEIRSTTGSVDVSFSVVQDLVGFPGGIGDLGDDPLFRDASAGDLRLSGGSPAIDAGDNAAALGEDLDVDLDGAARFVDDPDTEDTGAGDPPIVDIGAYEFQVDGPAGDIDGDGDVDLSDLATLLAAFDTCAGDPFYNPDADLDSSGCVDLADLATLLADFGVVP